MTNLQKKDKTIPKIPVWIKYILILSGCMLIGSLFGIFTKLSIGTLVLNFLAIVLWNCICWLIFWRIERGAK